MNLLLGQRHSLLLSHAYIDLHDVKCQSVLHIFRNKVTILPMTVCNPKVPQVLNLREVFDHKEVVLVCLRDAIASLTRSCQVRKLTH